MNLQSNTVSAALALVPVYPPKWITPVQPPGIAHGGLPLSAFMPSGVELIIDPLTGLLNWVVATYDVVTIFVNGSDTGVSKTIYPGEEGDRFLLLVAALWFKNGVNDVHYTVKRVGGNTDKSTTLQLLYNNPAPHVSVSHPPSIGPGQSASITITVGYARPYDTVTLTIGTWSITFTHPDPTQPIIHPLTAAELLLIGDGVHPVFATVRDQLSNSGVSATTSITISANQSPVVVAFIHGPYTATVGGQVSGIELIVTQTGQPIAGRTITVILPPGTTFADGTSVGNFTSDANGEVALTGVTAGSVVGAFSIRADSGGATATAALTIRARPPIREIALSHAPAFVSMSPDGTRAYIVGMDRVQVIDVATLSVTVMPLELPGNSTGIALNRAGTRAFVCGYNKVDDRGRLTVIDTLSFSLITYISTIGIPSRVVLSEDDALAFVSVYSTNTALVIDLQAFTVIKTIPVGSGSRGIAISPAGNPVYVANTFGVTSVGGIAEIDTKSLTLVGITPIPSPAFEIAVSSDGRSAYIAAGGTQFNHIYHYDTQTWTLIRVLPLVGQTSGITLDSTGNRAYAIEDESTVVVIDTASGQILDKIMAGPGASMAAITKDDTQAFVPSWTEKKIWVVPL